MVTLLVGIIFRQDGDQNVVWETLVPRYCSSCLEDPKFRKRSDDHHNNNNNNNNTVNVRKFKAQKLEVKLKQVCTCLYFVFLASFIFRSLLSFLHVFLHKVAYVENIEQTL